MSQGCNIFVTNLCSECLLISVSGRNIYLSKAWRASCFSFVCRAWSDVSLDCCTEGDTNVKGNRHKSLWLREWRQLERVKIYRLNAQFHSLSVQFNGFIIIFLLIFLKGLSDQEVGTLQVHLLPGLQGVALLCLDWGQRSTEATVRTYRQQTLCKMSL